MSLYCEYSDLKTESDVEQKFIYQLLTNPNPMGLGYKTSDIQTKQILRAHLIGKGKPKYYFPDYLIVMRGMPLLVVEAKAPNTDLGLAFSEARLYAAEVNSLFPHKINVCSKIIVCNGTETWAGYSDQSEPELRLLFEDFYTENIKYADLQKFCSKEQMVIYSNKPFIEARGKAIFSTPVSFLGGKRAQDEGLVENTYGRTLVFENRNIFDPQIEEDRIEIVKNAYITSSKREQHMEPMYREIKKIKLPSEINSTLISTDDPVEILDKLNKRVNMNGNSYSLFLVIGSVGSGKTTFVRYFKEVILSRDHREISDKCEWIFINMNYSPINKEEIYTWIKKEIISQIKAEHKEIKFNELDTIKKIFRDEVKEFEEGIGQIIKNDENTYNIELFKRISNCIGDLDINLKAILRYLKGHMNKIPIVVLDNCDKRNKDEQLLMFQVAEWIKDNYKCLVIFPMRDSTYDIYKNEPPLDTVVKDLVFRIDPPDLLKVLQKRLEYIFRLKEGNEEAYELDNGMNVIIRDKEQIEYFRCILMAIRNNSWAVRIFFNLTNRNIRDGIQLFEDFCKSGHIKSEDIFMIRTAGEEYELPPHIIINALLRKNRKYYNEEKSNFANLFYAKFDDDFPDPFVRIDVLLWLKNYYKIEGPNRVLGYHQVKSIIKDLQTIGHNEEVIYREISALIKKGLIYSENQLSDVNYNDLIKISHSGSLHLDLLNNLSYLAACAEDVIYKYPETMMRISNRITSADYLDKIPLIATAKDMLQYLSIYRSEFLSLPDVYLKEGEHLEIYDLKNSIDTMDNLIKRDNTAIKIFGIIDKYPKDLQVECKIISKKSNSLLCLINDESKGFLATTQRRFKLSEESYYSLNVGDNILCKCIEYRFEHNSIQLEFITKL